MLHSLLQESRALKVNLDDLDNDYEIAPSTLELDAAEITRHFNRLVKTENAIPNYINI